MKFDNDIPIYLQIVNEIKLYIVSGRLKPGDRLLSVREFAISFKVNPNTIQRALLELEELNLIYTERTNGKFVTSDSKLIEKTKKNLADNIKSKYLKDMENIGYSHEDAIEFLEKRYK